MSFYIGGFTMRLKPLYALNKAIFGMYGHQSGRVWGLYGVGFWDTVRFGGNFIAVSKLKFAVRRCPE